MPDHEPDNPSLTLEDAAAGRAPTTTTTTRRAKRPRLAKKDPAIAHEASRKQFEVAEVEATIRGVEEEATKLRTQIAEANTRMEALKESHKQLGQELVDYRLGERTVLLEHTIKTIKKEDCLTELSHDSVSSRSPFIPFLACLQGVFIFGNTFSFFGVPRLSRQCWILPKRPENGILLTARLGISSRDL